MVIRLFHAHIVKPCPRQGHKAIKNAKHNNLCASDVTSIDSIVRGDDNAYINN